MFGVYIPGFLVKQSCISNEGEIALINKAQYMLVILICELA